MNKSIKAWKTKDSTILFKNTNIEVVEDLVELPNGKEAKYLYTPSLIDSVAIIAINPKGELLLQQEYSYPPKQIMWQLPGGSINPQESIMDAAKRELSEESGYSFKSGKQIGYFYTNNRKSNKKQFIILAKDLYPNKLKEDDNEFIASYWLSLRKINTMIKNGEIQNINLLAALTLFNNI